MTKLAPAFALSAVLAAAGVAPAQVVTTYYEPAPVVAYPYPLVSASYYAPPPVVAYRAPVVSYYAPAPAVSYYAPAPAGVSTTTRYGPFGRPREVTRSYYYPGYVYP